MVLVLLLIAGAATANDLTLTSMQSGGSTTPIHDRGIHGEGQIIAILDTGADWTSCFLAEPDGSRPPINTGTPSGGLNWQNIDLSRRKIIAYNFLYSCDQYPDAPDCEESNEFDNHGHGTRAAATAAGDRGTPIVHDSGDAIAPAAKLVIQDGGLSAADACTSRPGFGCPVNITPILDQAYRQGVRIHSNSWGDRQSPTASYSQSAHDLDAFIWSHPDMLVVFNTGNGNTWNPAPSSLSAPGVAKNTLQVGGTRGAAGQTDRVLAGYSLSGPSRDGRIKPDVVGPAYVLAAAVDSTCAATWESGTSWASPTVAGAAALVRQYYMDGFYPGGVLIPSAALLKATIVAAARPVPHVWTGTARIDAAPVPSPQQGYGFPVLDDALYFPGDQRNLRVYDVTPGLAESESFETTVRVHPGTPFKAVLVWTDAPGAQLVNDLDLRVTSPSGAVLGGHDQVNNVEVITVAAPLEGTYTIRVSAPRLRQGPRQSYALVLTGDFADDPPRRRSVRR